MTHGDGGKWLTGTVRNDSDKPRKMTQRTTRNDSQGRREMTQTNHAKWLKRTTRNDSQGRQEDCSWRGRGKRHNVWRWCVEWCQTPEIEASCVLDTQPPPAVLVTSTCQSPLCFEQRLLHSTDKYVPVKLLTLVILLQKSVYFSFIYIMRTREPTDSHQTKSIQFD